MTKAGTRYAKGQISPKYRYNGSKIYMPLSCQIDRRLQILPPPCRFFTDAKTAIFYWVIVKVLPPTVWVVEKCGFISENIKEYD